MVLEEMLKLDDMAMPHSLVDHDLGLQFLLSLALCQGLLLNNLSSVSLSCFFRDEFKTLCKSSLNRPSSYLSKHSPLLVSLNQSILQLLDDHLYFLLILLLFFEHTFNDYYEMINLHMKHPCYQYLCFSAQSITRLFMNPLL